MILIVLIKAKFNSIITKELNEMNIDKAKLESTLNHLTEQINNIHVDENTMPDIKPFILKSIERKRKRKTTEGK